LVVVARPSIPDEERFMSRVENVGEHGLWIGGRFVVGKMVPALYA
jgi:hypothetical protein